MEDKKISVNGKVALVTGANRGIGRAITIELLETGAAKVYACSRDVASLKDLEEKYGEKLVALKLDVTDENSVEAAVKLATDVEVLINNAGVLVPGNFTNGNLMESMKSNFDVNVWGVARVTKAFLDIIKEKESGAIVIVSSVVGLGSMPMGLTYSASKAAVHSMIQGLRGELTDTNILVSGVYPGPIDTDMLKGLGEMEKTSPEVVAKNVVQGINAGTEDIYPDPMSEQIGEAYAKSPKAIEKQFSEWR